MFQNIISLEDKTELYIVVGFLGIIYIIIVPFFSWMLVLFYQHGKKIDNFYGNILNIDKINFISKTNSFYYWKRNTWLYIYAFASIFMLELFAIVSMLKKLNAIEILIVISSFVLLFIIPYAIVSIIWFIKMKPLYSSNNEGVDQLMDLINNWKLTDRTISYEFLKNGKLKEKFIKRQNKVSRRVKYMKGMINMNERRSTSLYSTKEWDKYLSIFSSYLYSNIWYCKKLKKKMNLSDQEFILLKTIVIDNFLAKTL